MNGNQHTAAKMSDEDYRQRLRARCLVDPFIGCWVYQGWRSGLQYGQMGYRGKNWAAHRLSYKLFKGEIPDGLDILHKCDNPPCCNPEHLTPGTPKENAEDSKAKKRHYTSSKTHCVRGHPLSGDNLYQRPGGRRVCKICDLAHNRIAKGWPEDLAYSLPKQRLCRKLGIGVGAPIKRGTSNKGKTHCIRGHELAGENLYIKPNGERQCRTCRRNVVKRIMAERSAHNGDGR